MLCSCSISVYLYLQRICCNCNALQRASSILLTTKFSVQRLTLSFAAIAMSSTEALTVLPQRLLFALLLHPPPHNSKFLSSWHGNLSWAAFQNHGDVAFHFAFGTLPHIWNHKSDFCLRPDQMTNTACQNICCVVCWTRLSWGSLSPTSQEKELFIAESTGIFLGPRPCFLGSNPPVYL